MVNMTAYQALAKIGADTGFYLRLTPSIHVIAWSFSPDVITLSYQRMKVTERRASVVYQATELVGLMFTRSNKGWVHHDPLTMPIEGEPVLHTSVYASAVERYEQAAWEEMCYRPGTPKSPMDGPGGTNPSVKVRLS